MRFYNKTTILALAALSSLALSSLFSSPVNAKADSWYAESEPSAKCNSHYKRGQWQDKLGENLNDTLWGCTPAGVSFAVFRYTVANPPDISIGPASKKSGDRVIVKGNKCGKTGGFIHLGITDVKNNADWYDGNTKVTVNGLVSIGNIQMHDAGDHWDAIFKEGIASNVGKQIVKVKNKNGSWDEVAVLDSFITKTEAKKQFDSWQKASGENVSWGGALNSFCWGETPPPGVNGGKATYTGSTSSSGDNGNVTNKGGKFSITFEHFLQRTDNGSFNPPNGNSWKTSVSGGIGSAKNGTFNGRARARVASDKVTGTLLPGEKRTFCQSITYKSNISSDGSSTTATSSQSCRTVWRDEATCFGRKYGVDNGKNYGKLSLNKNGSWVDAKPNIPEGFNNSIRNAAVEAWTKPGDSVAFKTEMCEGAELGNQYHNINKYISYDLNATENKYLGGLSPHNWNNASLRGKSNAGKGIFAGSYSKQTRSPGNGQFSINNSHVGKSFNQSLSWTDLWLSGGKIDTGHNPNGNTWTNTATGTVNTPYNYTTTISMSSNGLKYGLPGRSAGGFEMKYSTVARGNPKVSSSKYSTVSKPTKYQVFAFTVGKDVAADSVKLRNDTYVKDETGNLTIGSGNTCRRYVTAPSYDCKVIRSISSTTKINPGTTLSPPESFSVPVPDNAEIGSKVCVVGAIWPADSHDAPTTSLTKDSNQTPALRETGAYWHLSKPSCFAVAKKPTIQVRNSGAFAQRKVDTAISDRNGKLFGSWADYELIAGKKITGMASGAMLWGANSAPASAKNACYFSPLSLTNRQCNEGDKVGNFTVDRQAASHPATIIDKIKDRYASGTSSTVNGSVLPDPGHCKLNYETGKYEIADGTGFTCLDNGTNYTYANRDIHTRSGESHLLTDSANRSNTWVTRVNGTLYIDQNMYYGYPDTTYAELGDIVQRIFVAKDIKINANVTHIDAWLLAENSINTCYVPGGNEGRELVSVTDYNRRNGKRYTGCDNQLTVTGPVIAKNLYLYRTHGGNGGVESNSTAAEVFRLNPAVFMWSYAQSARSFQAPTVYQRELPTRY